MDTKITFNNYDKLDRKKFGSIFYKMIINADKLKKEDCASFTIALDGPWGSGKTTLLKMLENEYAKTDDKPKGLFVINYNAWENDYTNNPLESLVYAIFKEENFKNLIHGDQTKDVIIKEGKKLIEEVSKINSTTETIFKVCKYIIDGIKGVENIVDLENSDLVNNYTKEKNNLRDIKENIKKCVEKITLGRELIVVIDELDRCKPTFAIETLELVKHLFDISRVTFVFSLDLSSLKYSIGKVYGEGIDTYGYLAKFFDQIITIPKVYDYSLLIENKLDLICNDDDKISKETLVKIINEYAIAYDLSLRDIDIIMNNYKLMHIDFLRKYKKEKAYKLYIGLLIMKYKKRDWYNMIFKENRVNDFLGIIKNDTSEVIKYYNSVHVGDEDINYYNLNTSLYNLNEIYSFENEKLRVKYNYPYSYINEYKTLLFEEDIIDILKNKIEAKTISEYIGRKLDIFDFNEKLL